jgi:hypothetical protein
MQLEMFLFHIGCAIRHDCSYTCWRCPRITVVIIFINHINRNIVGPVEFSLSEEAEWIMLPNLARPLAREALLHLLFCYAKLLIKEHTIFGRS